jgi:tetratricopeptide (TPR) repeat protein
LAANNQNYDALCGLAIMYAQGRGTESQKPEYEKAHDLLKKALEINPKHVRTIEALKNLQAIKPGNSTAINNPAQTPRLFSANPTAAPNHSISSPSVSSSRNGHNTSQITTFANDKDQIIAALQQTIKAQATTIAAQEALIQNLQLSSGKNKRKIDSEISTSEDNRPKKR